MNTSDLRETLARLHEQLRASPRIDSESRQLLRQILADLDRPTATADVHGHRLEALAVDFEVEHPALAAGLRELAAILGRAGV